MLCLKVKTPKIIKSNLILWIFSGSKEGSRPTSARPLSGRVSATGERPSSAARPVSAAKDKPLSRPGSGKPPSPAGSRPQSVTGGSRPQSAAGSKKDSRPTSAARGKHLSIFLGNIVL